MNSIKGLADIIVGYVNTITILLIGLSTIWLIINVIKFMTSADEPEERKKGQISILISIVSLAIIVSTWGLVGIVLKTFNF